MPFQVLPDLPETKKTPQEKPHTASGSPLSLFEKLLTLVIAWQYFHFTGKAIANGQKLPKDWLKMKERILPKKVQEVIEEPKKEKKPGTYKVVDLATQKPISIP